MKLKNFALEQSGALKEALITSVVFSAGIGIGLFFLKRKHEEELDKLEKDTAMNCLDVAAAHYEGVLRRREKESNVTVGSMVQPVTMTPYYEEFLEFQRKLDNAGKQKATEEEWAALKEEIAHPDKEIEELMKKSQERLTQLDIEIDRAKLGLLSAKATELAEKASVQRNQPPDVDSEEFQREIDAMNNYEEPEE